MRCVYATAVTEKPISARLWKVMMVEFDRNGGRVLTRGKVRYLRRRLRDPVRVPLNLPLRPGLSKRDFRRVHEAVARGDFAAARAAVEAKGLTWIDYDAPDGWPECAGER